MSEWATSTEPCTWGGLVAYACECGASLETLKDCPYPDDETRNVMFLMREHEGETRTFVLPHDCYPEKRVGPLKWLAAFARLGIKRPEWAVEM